MKILLSIAIFILAGLCEIGGGYLVWLCLREHKSWWVGALGGIILIAYGVVATLQTENFGRVDGVIPDRYDLIGGLIALLGMCIIMFSPRS